MVVGDVVCLGQTKLNGSGGGGGLLLLLVDQFSETIYEGSSFIFISFDTKQVTTAARFRWMARKNIRKGISRRKSIHLDPVTEYLSTVHVGPIGKHYWNKQKFYK